MKKILVLITSVLILMLVGCGNNDVTKNDPNAIVLGTVFHADDYGKYIDQVNKSGLSDEDKKAFENLIRSDDPRIWEGKSIEEMIDISKKAAEEAKKKETEKQEAKSKISSEVVLVDSYKMPYVRQNDPVRLENPEPYLDGYNIHYVMNICNNSSKILKAVRYKVTFFNDFGEQITSYEDDITKLNVSPGGSVQYYHNTGYGEGSDIGSMIKSNTNIRIKTAIETVKALYADGSVESI